MDKNPFLGYALKIQEEKKNPVHEIVNLYLRVRNLDKMDKQWYKENIDYPRLCRDAKMLLARCSGNIEDAMWCIDKMKYLAEKGKFEWRISTCLKHNLI